ncbi:MAG: imidazole glycerol phosphate synthase subunit HisF [Synergistaceae bacterium]|jgi:cyclase|nr:imidazole glycerol phosphate synthase subunit HisF [Synergistaceae bacterium]
MLTKRIIPCLDVKGGRVVKGINFVNLRDAGDPATLALTYMNEGADELTFLDITASNERRATMLEWVRVVADAISIPFTVGGGISSPGDAVGLVALGADKISLNTAAVRRPELITECASALGSQAVVVAVDVKRDGDRRRVFIEGGRAPTERDGFEWCLEAASLGAGELLITSMDHDGTKAGYDVEFLAQVSGAVGIPAIASGGAGTSRHVLEAFERGADAALLASVFHFGEIRIRDMKNYLRENGVPVRL